MVNLRPILLALALACLAAFLASCESTVFSNTGGAGVQSLGVPAKYRQGVENYDQSAEKPRNGLAQTRT